MLSNKDIRRRELFRQRQNLIKACGELKKAQNDLVLAFNECALAEICHYNSLKKQCVTLKMKSAVKHYFKVFGNKYLIEEHIEQLEKWKAEE